MTWDDLTAEERLLAHRRYLLGAVPAAADAWALGWRRVWLRREASHLAAGRAAAVEVAEHLASQATGHPDRPRRG